MSSRRDAGGAVQGVLPAAHLAALVDRHQDLEVRDQLLGARPGPEPGDLLGHRVAEVPAQLVVEVEVGALEPGRLGGVEQLREPRGDLDGVAVLEAGALVVAVGVRQDHPLGADHLAGAAGDVVVLPQRRRRRVVARPRLGVLALGGVGAQRAARRERLGGYDVEDAVPPVAADLQQPVDLVLADLGQRPGASAGDHEVAVDGLDGVDRLGEEPGVLPDQHRGRRGRRTRLALGRRPSRRATSTLPSSPPRPLSAGSGSCDGGRRERRGRSASRRGRGGGRRPGTGGPARPGLPDVVDDHREPADGGQPDVHL